MLACIKKEVGGGGGGGGGVGPSLCPTMENLDPVFQKTGDSSLTHSRRLTVIADKLYPVSAKPDRADRMVPPVRVFPSNMLLVAPALSGPVFAT